MESDRRVFGLTATIWAFAALLVVAGVRKIVTPTAASELADAVSK